MLRIIFQAKSSARILRGGGNFLRGRNCPEEILRGCVFYVGETFQGGFLLEGTEFFMEGEPDLLALLENDL